ncbi:MAG: hypothetical protein CMJ50_08620 [Planctomycetaceae bacterium]|nr:hypothetical protein [Planctomycetaceae bacterium]
MLLRDSQHKGTAMYDAVLEIAAAAKGTDRLFCTNESSFRRRARTVGWSGNGSPQPSDSSRRPEAQPR